MLVRQTVPKSLSAVVTSPINTNVSVLGTGYIYATSVVLHAPSTNTSDVLIGGADLSSSNGIPLSPGQTFSIAVDSTGVIEKIKASELYVRSGSTANEIRVFALIGE
jgi:hypothetical protein